MMLQPFPNALQLSRVSRIPGAPIPDDGLIRPIVRLTNCRTKPRSALVREWPGRIASVFGYCHAVGSGSGGAQQQHSNRQLIRVSSPCPIVLHVGCWCTTIPRQSPVRVAHGKWEDKPEGGKNGEKRHGDRRS